ncbi:multidrug resistance protein A [Trypanosoma cruzi]|uniref:Multidrug resistance protein A n=1 Tax=Trypanosoma cruzi TaxID=5693 RepID=A0A2V2UNA7_TRYCR|nr:multidrug resistance protein A [Trypanosoma cruzi]
MRQGSRNLHRLILRSVSIGTMQYFDTTPLGRIVNRFSRDVDCIDNQLQMTFLFLLRFCTAYFLLLLWPSTHSHMSFWHCFPRCFLLQVDGPLQRHQQRNSSRRQHREGADDITSWRGTCWLLYHQGIRMRGIHNEGVTAADRPCVCLFFPRKTQRIAG